MTVLTGEQFEQLQHLLTEALDKRAIEELARKRLGRRLDTILNADQSTQKIVFELLTWIDQRGLSTLEVVLQGVVAERPGDVALRAFCEQTVPAALKPSDTQPSSKDLISGAPQPFIGVPPRIATFTGRTGDLDRLDAILMHDKPAPVMPPSVRRAAVHGMGGIGKSALAVEYAHRFRDLYAGVCWCPAETHTGLLSALAGLAVTLGAAAAEEANVEKAANAALRRLAEQRTTWLLVYDNVPAPDAIADLLPSAGARVLITSRFSDWSELAGEVPLDVLPLDEAVALLHRRTGRSDAAGANALAEVLGRLPLALDHAAAYCKRTQMQFGEYSNKASSLINAAPRGVGYPRSVAATFDLAITQAVTQCPVAEELMAYLAQCAPERIPTTLVESAVDDETERLQALASLAEVSLLKHDPFEDGTPAVTVHRLVQAIARAQANGSAKTAEAVARLIARLAVIYPDNAYNNPDLWPQCAHVTPHLIALHEGARDAAVVIADWPELLNRAGGYFLGRGAYSQAAPFLRDALAIREKALGPEHPDTAESLNNLATLLSAQGDYRGARPLIERALAIRQRTLGPENPATAESLDGLAGLLHRQRDFAGARPLYECALAIREKALGPEHSDTANSLNNLGGLLSNQGDYRGARPLYERALAIRQRALGAEHPKTADSLNNLAFVLRADGDFAGALSLYQRALSITEKIFGPEHPRTATSLNNLAFHLNAQGDVAGARSLYQCALSITEKALGPEHPDTAGSLSNLAGLLAEQGDLVGAQPLFERALAIFEKVLGPEHPDTAISLQHLALLRQDQGEREATRPLLERALGINEKALGSEHRDTNRTRCYLARLLIATSEPNEALALADTALAGHEKLLGRDHPWTKDSARFTADALDAVGRTDEASALREKYGIAPEAPTAS